jgi:UDP-3-O-[3-hydroxymyristoyl] glucosamine N-acyltransferase
VRQRALDEIATLLGGRVCGDGARTVCGVAPPDQPREDAICVLWQPKLAAGLPPGVALLAPPGSIPEGRDGVEVRDPRAALCDLLPLLAPARETRPGTHPSAVIDATATIHPTASIGPLCVVGTDARIGAGAVLEAQVFVGARVSIGANTRCAAQVALGDDTEIGAGVLVHGGSVLGADGFGFIPDGAGGHRKIPQVGRVVIEDDVEIGALCTVDRATIGETRIGRGTKLDDHVHVGHNCRIGANCILVAFVGLAGSATVEDGVVLAAQAGVSPHVTIGRNTVVGGRGGVTADVPAGMFVSGFPAQEHRAELRQAAFVRRLPELYDRVRKLEKR